MPAGLRSSPGSPDTATRWQPRDGSLATVKWRCNSGPGSRSFRLAVLAWAQRRGLQASGAEAAGWLFNWRQVSPIAWPMRGDDQNNTAAQARWSARTEDVTPPDSAAISPSTRPRRVARGTSSVDGARPGQPSTGSSATLPALAQLRAERTFQNRVEALLPRARHRRPAPPGRRLPVTLQQPP